MKQLIITNIGNFLTDEEPILDEDNKLTIVTTNKELKDGKKIYSCTDKVKLDLNYVTIFARNYYSDLEEIPKLIPDLKTDLKLLTKEIEERQERLDEINKAMQDEDFKQYLFHEAEMKKFEENYKDKQK